MRKTGESAISNELVTSGLASVERGDRQPPQLEAMNSGRRGVQNCQLRTQSGLVGAWLHGS